MGLENLAVNQSVEGGGDFLWLSSSVRVVTLNPLSSPLERSPGLGSGDLYLYFCHNSYAQAL